MLRVELFLRKQTSFFFFNLKILLILDPTKHLDESIWIYSTNSGYLSFSEPKGLYVLYGSLLQEENLSRKCCIKNGISQAKTECESFSVWGLPPV